MYKLTARCPLCGQIEEIFCEADCAPEFVVAIVPTGAHEERELLVECCCGDEKCNPQQSCWNFEFICFEKKEEIRCTKSSGQKAI